jgi:hypothetical protein
MIGSIGSMPAATGEGATNVATLLDKLSARIAAERQEIVRIQDDAVRNRKQAEARLQVLESAAEVLSQQPKLELLLVELRALGVNLEG